MRRLATLFAAVVAVLLASAVAAAPSYAATTPAYTSAAVLPDCATALPAGAAGTSSSCTTQGPPGVACMGCGVRRTVDVVVTAGRAGATLVCDGRASTIYVDGPGTGTFGVWGGQNCTLTLTAAVDGTSAAATSTASYVFITA